METAFINEFREPLPIYLVKSFWILSQHTHNHITCIQHWNGHDFYHSLNWISAISTSLEHILSLRIYSHWRQANWAISFLLFVCTKCNFMAMTKLNAQFWFCTFIAKKKISSEAVKNCNAKREIDEPKLETALFLVCTNGDYKPKKDTLHLNATEKR